MSLGQGTAMILAGAAAERFAPSLVIATAGAIGAVAAIAVALSTHGCADWRDSDFLRGQVVDSNQDEPITGRGVMRVVCESAPAAGHRVLLPVGGAWWWSGVGLAPAAGHRVLLPVGGAWWCSGVGLAPAAGHRVLLPVGGAWWWWCGFSPSRRSSGAPSCRWCLVVEWCGFSPSRRSSGAPSCRWCLVVEWCGFQPQPPVIGCSFLLPPVPVISVGDAVHYARFLAGVPNRGGTCTTRSDFHRSHHHIVRNVPIRGPVTSDLTQQVT